VNLDKQMGMLVEQYASREKCGLWAQIITGP